MIASGVDLLTLPVPRLMSVVISTWMDWATTRDEEVAKAQASFIRKLTDATAAYERRHEPVVEYDPAGTDTNPFPDIMRHGAVGTIGE